MVVVGSGATAGRFMPRAFQQVEEFGGFAAAAGSSGLCGAYGLARSLGLSRRDTLELGADDYLVKPFSVRELVARLRAILFEYEVVVAVAICTPPRYTRYPATPTLSLEGDQDRLIWLEEITDAESPPGTEGGVVSGESIEVSFSPFSQRDHQFALRLGEPQGCRRSPL